MINMICRINRIYGIFLIGHIDPVQLFDNMGIIELTLLKKLIEKVRKFDEVELKVLEEDIATEGIMKLEEQSGSFDFLYDEREDIYSVNDLKVRYK